MKTFLLIACLLGLAGPATASTEQVDIPALLEAQANRWDKAIVEKNVPGILENIGTQFRQIDGDGSIISREDFVADLVSPDLKINPYKVEDFDIRIYGDIALLCGRTRMTGKYKDKAFTSHYRYVDTYHFEEGHWRVIQIQITRIP